MENLKSLAYNYSAALNNVQTACTSSDVEACGKALDMAAQTKFNLLQGTQNTAAGALTMPLTFLGGPLPSTKAEVGAAAWQDMIDERLRQMQALKSQEEEKRKREEEEKKRKQEQDRKLQELIDELKKQEEERKKQQSQQNGAGTAK